MRTQKFFGFFYFFTGNNLTNLELHFHKIVKSNFFFCFNIYNRSFFLFFFCFFYTAIIFDPKDVAENLKKAGGFIPGIRPGEKTQEYLDAVLSRLTLWGGVYISVISVLPMLLIAEFNVPFYFGGTSILILVGVAMDFMSQIESHLISRQYEGLMGKTRIKGRS